MTDEEINKKAEKHCNDVLCNAHEKCYEVIKCRDWRSRRAGFFCGYEQALKDFEKENAELKKACDETQALLDKQIEATYKVVEENKELKEKFNKATEILKVVLNKWKEERWILQSEKEVKMIENVMKEAEAFLEVK